MKNLIVLILIFSIAFTANSQKATIIYVVRHVEKVTADPNNKDPFITDKGQQRSVDLANKLKKSKLSAVYSTNFQRTKLTVKPIADEQSLTVKIYDPKQIKSFVSIILQENKGGKILIVGHSNTVLETIEALGGERPIPEIKDQEYDYFFTVKVANDGTVTVKMKHYGAKNSENEGLQLMKTN